MPAGGADVRRSTSGRMRTATKPKPQPQVVGAITKITFVVTWSSHNLVAGGTVNNIVSDFTNVKSVRVLRDGSWVSDAKFVRVSDRTRFTPRVTNKARGFRCVKPIIP